ncbi:MAG: hypothetical protein AAFZ18_34205 [Myxococcota bacterium]
MHLSAEGSVLRLDVSDTGIGMTPETAASVFDPFTQAEVHGDLALLREFERVPGDVEQDLPKPHRIPEDPRGEIRIDVCGEGDLRLAASGANNSERVVDPRR